MVFRIEGHGGPLSLFGFSSFHIRVTGEFIGSTIEELTTY